MLSMDAISKAKAALQKHKDLKAKLDANAKVKAALASKTPSTTTPTVPAGAQPTATPASLAQPALEKVMMLAQSLSQKAGVQGIPMAPAGGFQPPPLRVDALGRELDASGQVITSTVVPPSTLKVNIAKQKMEEMKGVPTPENPEDSAFYDPRMGSSKGSLDRRGRRAFAFLEQGKLEKAAQRARIKARFGDEALEQMMAREQQEKMAAKAAAAGPSKDVNLIPLGQRASAPEVEAKAKVEPVPEVEWWDAPLLENKHYDSVRGGNWKVNATKMNIYVEHPVKLEPPMEAAAPPPQPLKLTKKEHKKLRTQRRLQREKERQEMIKQGLLEPPKPKVKISNLMRVMGMEATADPTQIEKEVREQMAERSTAHEDRNLARKLTASERRDKKSRKMFEDDLHPETMAAVYKVKNLTNKHNQWKVDINAQENKLTGCCILMDESFSLVVVEGTFKALKRYSKLMLRRIDWEEGKDLDDEDVERNVCVLVWQGAVEKAVYKRFKFETCRTEGAAKKLLTDAGVGHFWDLAYNSGWEGITEIE